MQKKVSCVDLFCGAGGLTHGLLKEGISVRAGLDLDEACQFPYEHNNHGAQFIRADIATVKASDIQGLYEPNTYRLLAGCAPCQPFSTYRQGSDVRKDGKWGLLYHFANLVQQLKPDFVTMENVPSVEKHGVFHTFVTVLKQLYHVTYGVVDCAQYGLPQSRKRMVLIASKHGNIQLAPSTARKIKTVRDTIAKLPAIAAGESHPKDPLHIASKLSPLNLKRIRASKPGGTWRDWPEKLIADCHRQPSGQTYPGVYGRMEWGKPAPTMTTQCFGFGNGRFGHPIQDRGISLREAALFQGFPKSYQFVPPGKPVSMKAAGRKERQSRCFGVCIIL